MAKTKTRYVCDDCGHDEPKWLGHCPSCGSWNSFKEFKISKSSTTNHSSKVGETPKAIAISDIPNSEKPRLDTGMSELNRVLGDGVMKGSAVLVGGEPGIGKSTLLLQLASYMSVSYKVLYISGEESGEQIKLRGERLKLDLTRPMLLCDHVLEQILHVCDEEKPQLVIIDSVQTLISPEAGEIPGTVSQLKLCTNRLIDWARKTGTTLFLVAHVTKEGTIAGPRAVEHMVDTVLYFEHTGDELRCLRAQKNRFGSTQEIGLFLMNEKGLEEVKDPNALFLQERSQIPQPGTATTSLYEGSRILLVEIQALTVPAKGGMSRVYSEKIDHNRISRISAVLEKHIGIKFSDQDLYIHVAGGLRISEPGADLPIALALYSARTGIAIKTGLLAMGELSLTGKIRRVPHLERRIKAGQDQGYNPILIPAGKNESAKNLQAENLKDAIQLAFK